MNLRQSAVHCRAIEVLTLLSCFLYFALSPAVSFAQNPENEAVSHLGWGGGGVFTSVIEHNGNIYASSDVSGVWKREGQQWHPFVDGLTNYNITGLFTHADKLFALTKDSLQVLGDDNSWQALGVSLSTVRNTSTQYYSTSGNGRTCLAALEPKLVCIDADMSISQIPLKMDTLHGVYFRPAFDSFVLGFYKNQLYKIDFATGKQYVVKTFDTDIVRIVKFDHIERSVLFTKTAAYKVGTFTEIPFEKGSKTILNTMVADTSTLNKNFIALGNSWSANVYELICTEAQLTLGNQVSVDYDADLPFRRWRTSLTQPVGMPAVVNDTVWFGDYWGVFAYAPDTGTFSEQSKNAANFVGTDLHIANNQLYIASMDNGLVTIPLDDTSHFNNIFPRTGTDWELAGHVWSIAEEQSGIYATLSPWNLANDYLLSLDDMGNFQHARQISHTNSRYAQGTFWGQSYARKLVAGDQLYTYKDGVEGGLFTLPFATPGEAPPATTIVESDSELLFATARNRVFNALALFENELVSYHIDTIPSLKFIEPHSGAVLNEVDAPAGFWAFGMAHFDDELYLLGAQGEAIIYQYAQGQFIPYLTVPESSAVYSMAESHDRTLQIVGTVGWDENPVGKVLIKRSADNQWIDATCLMNNRSGAVDMVFDAAQENVYILQHVGGITRISTGFLHTFAGCDN